MFSTPLFPISFPFTLTFYFSLYFLLSSSTFHFPSSSTFRFPSSSTLAVFVRYICAYRSHYCSSSRVFFYLVGRLALFLLDCSCSNGAMSSERKANTCKDIAVFKGIANTIYTLCTVYLSRPQRNEFNLGT